MPEPTCLCPEPTLQTYCDRCDALLGLDGLHVLAVERDEDGLRLLVESAPKPMGCPTCGSLAAGHGRLQVSLIDAPAFGARCA